MNALTKNLGWILAGVFGVAALGVFGAMVFPLYGSIGEKAGLIQDQGSQLGSKAKGPLPAPEDLTAYGALRTDLDKLYKDTVAFYDSIDREFEKWFPEIQVLERDPRPDDFKIRYQTYALRLTEKLLESKVAVGMFRPRDPSTPPPDTGPLRGFNWENLAGNVGELTVPVMKQLQKRFWIRERIATVCMLKSNPDLKVERMLEVYFPQFINKLDDPGTPPAVAKEDRFENPRYNPSERSLNWFTLSQGASALGPVIGLYPEGETFIKNVLPAPGAPPPPPGSPLPPWDLGRTITFCFCVQLPLDQIPSFLDRFLDVNTKPQMFLNVISTRVVQYDYNEPEIKREVDRGQGATLKATLERELKPQNPLLMVVGQVIDFDPSKAQKP